MAQTLRRLIRSRTNRIIAGVCGGLGAYFHLDPTLVRIGFVIIGCIWGTGILLYIVMAIIVPLEGVNEAEPNLRNRIEGAAREVKESAQKIASDFKRDKK